MKRLKVDFADFAITAIIFDHVFVESLNPHKTAHELTREEVERLSNEKKRPVGVKDLVRALKISRDQASRKLRTAAAAGTISRTNRPEKGNRKLYVAASAPRFAPDPEKLFQELKIIKGRVRFVHPITGKEIEYRREPK
ncbi:MAG TPA: hypothetical protein VFA90_01925 [Terriglobales bacterium]|nr:hypothetical protein [Terriglobales bacterium]